MNQKRSETLLKLLACPTCSGSFEATEQQLKCQGCGALYPVRNGVPIFLPNPHTVKVMPSDHISNQMAEAVVEWLANLDGYSLNIGAGATARKIPQCIELEYSLFKTTDVIGDSHHLPFKNDSFDAVVAFNVFEHLHSPAVAAAEIFRVLKPGGKVIIHTAFLQPLHEEPFHYFNATEHGVTQWFSRFDIEVCQVSNNFNPAFTLAWLSSDVLYFVESLYGAQTAQQLANTTLEEWRQLWVDESKRKGWLWDIMSNLPQSIQKRFSAGFELKATKPLALVQDNQKIYSESNIQEPLETNKTQTETTDLLVRQLIQELAWQKQQTEKYKKECEAIEQRLKEQRSNLSYSPIALIKTLFRLLKTRTKIK